MKRSITFILSTVLLLTLLLSLASCSEQKIANPIDFGKKYMLSDSRYYVFNENGTGYCEWRYTYSDSMTSGRVHFAWREASDGGVYLFRTGTEFYDDHTSKSTIPLIKNAIYFGEEFFTYLYSSEVLDMRSVVYLKEGSELKKLVDD